VIIKNFIRQYENNSFLLWFNCGINDVGYRNKDKHNDRKRRHDDRACRCIYNFFKDYERQMANLDQLEQYTYTYEYLNDYDEKCDYYENQLILFHNKIDKYCSRCLKYFDHLNW
jgi:hypothetical protein